MKEILLAIVALVLAGAILVATGIVQIDATATVKLNNTGNLTALNVTLPDSLTACVFGNAPAGIPTMLDYHGRNVTINTTILSSELSLSGDVAPCAVMIVRDEYMSRMTRKAVKERFDSGASLVVEKLAATLIHDDPAVYGWEIGYPGQTLQDVLPVKMDLPNNEPEALGDVLFSGYFMVRDNFLFKGVKNFRFENWNVTKTFKTTNAATEAADLVDTLDAEVRATRTAYNGILYTRKNLGGLSVYFAIPLDASPTVTGAVLETLLYDYMQRNYPI